MAQAPIQAGIENASRLASKIPIVIFEHHILRSEKWREESNSVYDAASTAEHKVMTAAEYLKTPNMLLESSGNGCMRKRLHRRSSLNGLSFVGRKSGYRLPQFKAVDDRSDPRKGSVEQLIWLD